MESICTWWRSLTGMQSVKGLRRVLGVLRVRRYWWRQGVCFVDSQASLLAYIKWVWRCVIFGYPTAQNATGQVVGSSVCFPVAWCFLGMAVTEHRHTLYVKIGESGIFQVAQCAAVGWWCLWADALATGSLSELPIAYALENIFNFFEVEWWAEKSLCTRPCCDPCSQ